MNNKRTLTKAGGIVSIVAWALNILMCLYLGYIIMVLYAFASASDVDVMGYYSLLIGSTIGSLVVSILLLVYSIKVLKFTKLNCKEFVAKKGTIIFVAVVNILNFIYSIYSMIGVGFDWTSAVSLVIALALLTSAILILIDFSKAQKEANAEKLAEQTAQNIESANQTQTVVDAQVKEESIEDKLEKLNKMKVDGLISEEEYNQMKADLLK